jgi:hypothetical protein
MKALQATIVAVAAFALCRCSTNAASDVNFILDLKSPVLIASQLDQSKYSTLIRVDESGTVQQAVQTAQGNDWTVSRKEVPASHVSNLIALASEIPAAKFGQTERMPRFFSVQAHIPSEKILLVYNDGSLPCSDVGFKAFQSFWIALANDLPSPPDPKGLPNCSVTEPPAN